MSVVVSQPEVNTVCAICETHSGRTFTVPEMMFGTGETFRFRECYVCHCLQQLDPPADMSRFYPPDYYSRELDLTKLDAWLYKAYFGMPSLGPLLRRWRGEYFADQKFEAMLPILSEVRRGARILDVGCGAGKLVRVLRGLGYYAQGIDVFATASEDVKTLSLSQTPGGWDVIMFHHSTYCVDVNRVDYDGERVAIFVTNSCHVRVNYLEYHWAFLSPDGTNIKQGYDNDAHCPVPTMLGDKAECDLRIEFDNRASVLRVWVSNVAKAYDH